MATLSGPPMQPPNTPMFTGDDHRDIQILIDYLTSLVSYLYEYRPTVEAP